jgi:hypothetical protein
MGMEMGMGLSQINKNIRVEYFSAQAFLDIPNANAALTGTCGQRSLEFLFAFIAWSRVGALRLRSRKDFCFCKCKWHTPTHSPIFLT